ncbi:MAG: hypothetical protein WCC84_16745 [Candidatus Cybelea sp.]
MADFLAELNRLMDLLALEPDVSATALVGGDTMFLVLSDDCGKYVAHDAWIADSDAILQDPHEHGSLAARGCKLAGIDVTFLFGDTCWAAEPLRTEARSMADDLYGVYDPRALIRNLVAKTGKHRIEFASNDEVAKYGDVSSDFFRIIGLGHAVFISDTSTLRDWCEASGLSLEHANARIHEVYGVDVSDLDGGRLIDVFERIHQGNYYRTWRAEH